MKNERRFGNNTVEVLLLPSWQFHKIYLLPKTKFSQQHKNVKIDLDIFMLLGKLLFSCVPVGKPIKR